MVFGWGKKKAEKENPPTVAQEITISDVLTHVDAMYRQESERLVEQTKKLVLPISDHIESLLRIATELEKDKLDTDDVDTNIDTIVQRGKAQVLDKIKKEAARNLPDIDSVNAVREFNQTASQILAKIGGVLGKQTRVIHIFAKKHAGKLKFILERFKDDVDHSNRLLGRFDEFERNKKTISELLSKLDSEHSSIQNNLEKISGLKKSAAADAQKRDSIQHDIDDFMASAKYEKYTAIQTKLSNLDTKKSQIKSQINNQTILISRPVSKYEYGSALDKEDKILVEKFLSSPFDVFLPENRAGIMTILNNIKKAINQNHISVKEPAKTLSYIDDIISGVDSFIESVNSVTMERQRLHEELKTLDLDILEGYQKQHSKLSENIDFAESRTRELHSEIRALEANRPSYIRDTEYVINRMGHVRFTIRDTP